MKAFIPSSHIISVKTLAMLSQVYETFIFRRPRQIQGNKLKHEEQEDTRHAIIYYLKCILFIINALNVSEQKNNIVWV